MNAAPAAGTIPMFAELWYAHAVLRRWKANPSASKLQIGVRHELVGGYGTKPPAVVACRGGAPEALVATARADQL